MSIATSTALAGVPHSRAMRYYDLDALRAFAMFLGVVLHASLFLVPDAEWPVKEAVPAAAGDLYGTVVSAIHGFRMPLFFLLSGFFSALLWQRRSRRAMMRQRLQRIGIPLAAGCVTILPLTTVIIIDVDPPRADVPLWIAPASSLFHMMHLWFLWYLLLMAVGFALLIRLGLEFRNRLLWWLAIPLTLPLQMLMEEPDFGADSIFGVYIPAIENELALLPNPVLLGYYFLYFLFGVFLYQRAFQIRRWWTVALIPAAPVFVAGMHFLYDSPGEPQRLASAPFQTAYAWLMCFGMLGLFRWVFARPSFWVRYCSDSSYWVYLMHVPLVIVVQHLVAGLPIHDHMKFLLVLGSVTSLLLAAYQLGVRHTFIGRTLNGPRTRRRQTDFATP